MKKFYFALLILSACEQNDNFSEPIYDVPEELQPLVDLFIEEASTRGETVTIDNLILEYSSEVEDNVCGLCQTERNGQKRVIIRNEANICWITKEQFETLVFHELGHCILNRNHLDEMLPNGEPKSIMISNNTDLYSSCSFNVTGGNNSCDNTFKREYYLNELFDDTTSEPEWSLSQ